MADAKWNAWVWIKWKPGTPSNAWETWQKNPTIKSAWSMMGEWDCCLWLDVQTPGELEEFVWRNIRKNEWVSATHTTWTKQWW